MAVLKSILDRAKRLKSGEKPLPVIRTVNPPEARESKVDDGPVPETQPGKDAETSIPDYNAEALSLAGEPSPDDDPYATHSWEMDPETDTRRLKKLQIGDQPTGGDESNPYNSATPRRGWKK